MNTRTRAVLIALLALPLAGVALALGRAAPADRAAALETLQTPSGPARVAIGNLDAGSLRYAGETANARFFVGRDADNGYSCLVVARRAEGAATGVGCDPPGAASERGQFIQMAAADGGLVGAYRSFSPIAAARLDGEPVVTREGVVPFDIPPRSVTTISLETEAGPVRRRVRAGGPLAADRHGPAAAADRRPE